MVWFIPINLGLFPVPPFFGVACPKGVGARGIGPFARNAIMNKKE